MVKAKEKIGRKKRMNTKTERREAEMQEMTINGHGRKCPPSDGESHKNKKDEKD